MDQKNILIIDDEEYIRDMIMDFLDMEGFSGTPVKSIKDAVDVLTREDFDLILTDINLKNEDLKDLLEFIAVEEKKTPVILMTGDQNIDPQLSCNPFIKDILYKPFQIKNFFSKIKACLERE